MREIGNIERKKKADFLLYDCGLLGELKKYGTPHIIGSYRMDMMAWNDLDIDIENEDMSIEKLYDLTTYIIRTLQPIWYEAKEEINAEGKRVWFHGFETMITGELWNVDLWFFDQQTIADAESYCDNIASKANSSQKDAIVRIKEDLIEKGLYSFDKYRSIDVYKAVLEQNIGDVEEFLERYASGTIGFR